jgi:hypothetical protein
MSRLGDGPRDGNDAACSQSWLTDGAVNGAVQCGALSRAAPAGRTAIAAANMRSIRNLIRLPEAYGNPTFESLDGGLSAFLSSSSCSGCSMEVAMADRYRRRVSLAKAKADTSDTAMARRFILATAGIPLVAALSAGAAPLILPLTSVAALAVAAIVAFAAWRYTPANDGRRVTLWDLSGACALVGIAAGILADADELTTFLATTTR